MKEQSEKEILIDKLHYATRKMNKKDLWTYSLIITIKNRIREIE